jgi:hypothetical protein
VYGRAMLPAAAEPHVPAFVEMCLLPVWWAYKLVGAQAAWRLNNHPLFADGPTGTYIIGNMVVWGQFAALLAIAAAVVAARRQRRGRQASGAAKRKLE